MSTTNDGRPTPFAIVSMPRCGSSALSQWFSKVNQLSTTFEPFNPRLYQSRWNTLARDAGAAAALRLLRSVAPGLKHVWESNGWPFCDRPELNNDILLDGHHNVIYLSRRNYLRRLVSHLLSAKTGVWVGPETQFVRALDAVRLEPLDISLLRRQVERDKAEDRRRLDLLASHNCRVLHVHYEEMFEENDGIRQAALLDRMTTFLTGTAMLNATRPRVPCQRGRRWNNPAIYRRIPGIERVEAEVGSDDTGWLFA